MERKNSVGRSVLLWKAVEEVQWVALGMPRPQILGGATTP
jgi:hypothetical protein